MARRTFEEWYEDFLKYSQNGSVPVEFVTPEGNGLGAWVQRVRSGEAKLTSKQEQMLKNANFVWTVKGKYRKFEEWFWDFLKYNQNGYVPFDFITPEGNKLGQWVRSVRAGCIKLTCEQKQMLNDVNFIWIMQKPPRKFEEWYKDFLKYSQNGSVPVRFMTPEGNKLGLWVQSIRLGRTKLTNAQKEKLSQVGFCWEKIRKPRKFEEWYEDFLKYNQNGSVPRSFVTPEGNELGRWVQSIRSGGIKLTCKQKQVLNDVNFIWVMQRNNRKFEEWYEDFLKYNQNGSVPIKFITPEGKKLGIWVNNVRSGGIRLTDDQKQMLNDANFVWLVKKGKNHSYD